MLSIKENYYETIRHGNPEWVPTYGVTADAMLAGIFTIDAIEQPQVKSGPDCFGVPWIVTHEGSISDQGFHLFEDIADWRKSVIFPDLSNYDFKAMAAAEEKIVHLGNRSEMFLVGCSCCGLFERLVAFMGFENALMALVENPDECMNFLEAYSSFRIAYNNKIIDSFGLSAVAYFDDVATSQNLFMAAETYRSVIKPFEKRIADAVLARDVVFTRHCCGRCEELIPDFVEIGASAWHSAQTMNDLEGILNSYPNLAVEGGWDSMALFNQPSEGVDGLIEETKRCMSTYKQPGYVFMPVIITKEYGNALATGTDPRLPAIMEVYEQLKWF